MQSSGHSACGISSDATEGLTEFNYGSSTIPFVQDGYSTVQVVVMMRLVVKIHFLLFSFYYYAPL